MGSGIRRPPSGGMSRPFGSRPTYSGRRYMNRGAGWGNGPGGYGGNDIASLCCLLLCIGNMFGGNSGYYYDYDPDYYYNYNTTQYAPTTQNPTNFTNTASSTGTTLCQNCGQELRPDDEFCTYCGHKRT